MGTVTLSTDLPIAATTGCALARKPELFEFVVGPILAVRSLRRPQRIAPGARISGRLWWFGVLPGWTHHITLLELTDTEIRTREHGGLVRTWNHHLTFVPTGELSCRYTDEIEIDDGWRGALVRPVVHLLFRHRHRRWRTLAALLA
ncbi:SRPBCC family protein [Rhodococcus triatomae]|nr:hypothetical protein G419_02150 [Rhodococcus triatomae BKS 15-14]